MNTTEFYRVRLIHRVVGEEVAGGVVLLPRGVGALGHHLAAIATVTAAVALRTRLLA